MNYQVNTIDVKNLKVGDVIRDSSTNSYCKVSEITPKCVNFSEVSFYHPYDLTKLALYLFNFVNGAFPVEKIRIKLDSSWISVNNKSTEETLYKKILDRC